MMFIVLLSYNEGYTPETHTFGPYPSQEAAEEARIEFIRKMDESFDDWSQVWDTEVKAVRSFEQSYDRLFSELTLWQYSYKDERIVE